MNKLYDIPYFLPKNLRQHPNLLGLQSKLQGKERHFYYNTTEKNCCEILTSVPVRRWISRSCNFQPHRLFCFQSKFFIARSSVRQH